MKIAKITWQTCQKESYVRKRNVKNQIKELNGETIQEAESGELFTNVILKDLSKMKTRTNAGG